jgi:hypothetical protein
MTGATHGDRICRSGRTQFLPRHDDAGKMHNLGHALAPAPASCGGSHNVWK